jgi:polyhydroxybutyrate depolymerase
MVAIVLTFTACGDGPATVQHVDPITTPGTHIRYPGVSGFSRSYAIYVPESVQLNGPPVAAIMMLHGVPPIDMSAVTALNEAADASGFVAVYPKSNAGGEWTVACGKCTPNAVAGVDDVAYLRTVVEALPQILPVDPDRIFLSGFSNGGIMTFRAACQLSDEIAGFGPVGAGMWEWHLDNCDASRDVPMMVINGTDDPSFPYYGVPVETPVVGGDLLVRIEQGVAFWAEHNGCRPTPAVTDMPNAHADNTLVQRWTYQECDAETVYYRVEGGGHTWPSTPVTFNPALGDKSLDLNATDSLVAFFLRQRR